ncbi:MAG: histidine phosphatase family protein [Pararhizobium sp.]
MRGSPGLIVFRHGETDWNAAGRFQGLTDRPLTDVGREQAAAIGRNLLRLLTPEELAGSELVASPLQRASQTMAIVAARLGGRDWRCDPAVAEIGFGRWEGLTTHEVKAAFPEERRARKADRWRFRPQGGESFADLEARLRDWIARLDRPSIVATHAGAVRVLMHLCGGLAPEAAATFPVPHGRIVRFENGCAERLG